MKNKLVIFALITLPFFSIQAQKWVKTTPSYKNVVMEEFTGMHCGNCPRGHRKMDELMAAYPGRVFLINIHSGSFADPGLYYNDFRTAVGDSITKKSFVFGYPTANANRSDIPWHMGIEDAYKKAETLLNEESKLNIAVKSFVDFDKREITTEVEIYYTGDYSGPVNYLTIALTQDNILGFQSDYGNFNPDNWVDRLYKHNHVLRQFITNGTWGEAINETNKGSYTYRKYVTKIPEKYKDVRAYLYNMHVVAFVSQNSDGSKIMTADGAKVEFKPNSTDLSMKDMTERKYTLCYDSFNPKIEVCNHLNDTIHTFDVYAELYGIRYKKTFNGSLAKGEKTIVDWGNLPFLPDGAFTVKMIGFENINGNKLKDIDGSNNMVEFKNIGLKANAFTTFATDFENGLPPNMVLDHSYNKNVKVIKDSVIKYGNLESESALVFYLKDTFYVHKRFGIVEMGEADFTQMSDPAIGFAYAYSDGGLGGTAPEIRISISNDCGLYWTKVRSFTAQETGQPSVPGNLYDPKPGEYQVVKTTLKNYAGKKILIRITVTPGTTGNALFIDDININNMNSLKSNGQIKEELQFELFPNPANDNVLIQYVLKEDSASEILIYNAVMQMVYQKTIENSSPGNYSELIDVSSFAKGIYYISLKTKSGTIMKKIVIE